MGREVRRVPANWQHPRDAGGHLVPLLDGAFSAELSEWLEGERRWLAGEQQDYAAYPQIAWKPRGADKECTYTDWAGETPHAEDYMPEWPESERTHWQMYETTSEGTPLSPVMESPEALAHWLADNGASAFAGTTATYDQWLATIRRGFAPSAIDSPDTGMVSGVAALAAK